MIDIQNLSFSYNGKPFIENLNFSLADGTLTALIGENGSGKSTLLKLLTGNEKLSNGIIWADGKNTKKLSRRDRAKHISYFPQSRPVPDMQALDVVLMGRYPYMHGKFLIPEQERLFCLKMMQKMEIAHFAERNMQTLSFGERQKVYLVMQMVQNTPNLLLDEPTNFLDISAKFAMLAALTEMKMQGKCILCVLHDISLAMQYADRIIVMKNGNVFADGTPETLYQNGSIAKAFGVTIRRSEQDGKNIYVILANNSK